jgi:hypothetical protein
LIYNKIQRTVTVEDEWEREVAVSGTGVIWHWRLPPGARVEPRGSAFTVLLERAPGFLLELEPGASVRVDTAWLAPAYARRVPAPVIVVERPAGPDLKGRQRTVLKPVSNPGENTA